MKILLIALPFSKLGHEPPNLLMEKTEAPGRLSTPQAEKISPSYPQFIGECHKFRREVFDRHLPVSNEIAHEYIRRANEQDYVQANLYLLEIEKHTQKHDLNLADNSRHKAFAVEKSTICQRLRH